MRMCVFPILLASRFPNPLPGWGNYLKSCGGRIVQIGHTFRNKFDTYPRRRHVNPKAWWTMLLGRDEATRIAANMLNCRTRYVRL